MTEQELIKTIRELKHIQPSQDWVSLTKAQILGTSTELSASKEGKLDNIISVFRVFFLRPAYISVLSIFVVLGLWTSSQNSLPGDPLYLIKKLTEKGQAVFVSEQNLPKVQLEYANKRLAELNTIAQTNQVKKLAPALEEFQTNISKAAKELVKAKNPDVKEIVSETKKIKENKEKVESLGVVVGDTNELDSALLQLIEREIKDLEVSTLTDAQKEIFVKAVEDFKAGNYSEALEEIWLLSNNK